MAKLNDTLVITHMKSKAALRAIAEISPHRALKALEQYKYFLIYGGKRPFIHDSAGTIIAPVCEELVPSLEKSACYTIFDVTPSWPRQELRIMRRKMNVLIPLANAAYDRHEASMKEPADAPEPPTPTTTVEEGDGASDIVQQTVEYYRTVFSSTEVFTKTFGGRTVVAICWDGGCKSTKPRNREVWEHTSGKELHTQKGSGQANKLTAAKLEETGWKQAALKEHKVVLDHLAKKKVEAVCSTLVEEQAKPASTLAAAA